MRDRNSPTLRFGKDIGKPQCQELVSDGDRSMRFHQHSAVAVEDGKCKFHLSVERRRRERRDAYERESRNAADSGQRASAQAQSLGKALGIVVKPYWYMSGFHLLYTGEMIVPADFLENVVRAKEEGDWH